MRTRAHVQAVNAFGRYRALVVRTFKKCADKVQTQDPHKQGCPHCPHCPQYKTYELSLCARSPALGGVGTPSKLRGSFCEVIDAGRNDPAKTLAGALPELLTVNRRERCSLNKTKDSA